MHGTLMFSDVETTCVILSYCYFIHNSFGRIYFDLPRRCEHVKSVDYLQNEHVHKEFLSG